MEWKHKIVMLVYDQETAVLFYFFSVLYVSGLLNKDLLEYKNGCILLSFVY